MNTTCRACLNYTENGVRLLTLYKQCHYLPNIIMNCTGIRVDDSEVDLKLPLCQHCADKLIDINEFRTMYLESHDKLKKNLKECLKYSANDQNQPLLNNNNPSHEVLGNQMEIDVKPTKCAKIKMNPDDPYHNIIIDESQLIHHSNNKENNIVDMAMSMASVNTGSVSSTTVASSTNNMQSANGSMKKAKTARASKSRKKPASIMHLTAVEHDNKNISYESDANLLDMNNGNGNNGSTNELQYIILQSDTKIFSCSSCEQQFISEDFLKQHIQKAHPVVTELVQTPALSPMSLNQQSQQLIYLCHFCESKQFTSEIQLSHHMFIHSEISAGTLSDNPFPFCSCEHCLPLTTDKMTVAEYETAETEMVSMQQTIAAAPIEEQRHVVPATKTVATKQSVSTGGTLFSCSVCNKSTFKTQHRLMKHMRIHSNERPFACEICQKVYNASSSLKTHQRMAHNMVGGNANSNNPIENCAINSVVTDRSQQSASNSDGGGPVQCSICKKTFTKSYQLSVHMNTVHSKDRQYACPYCNDHFTMESKLTAHVKQHMEANNVITTTTNENEDGSSNADKISEMAME